MTDDDGTVTTSSDRQVGWLSNVLGDDPSRHMPATLKRLDSALANGVEGIYFLLGGDRLQVWNARRRLTAERNAKRLVEDLESMDEAEVARAPMEIETPILEKLSSTENELLSSLLIGLLTAAASKSHGYSVHPSMIGVVNDLSPDEALILNSFRERNVSFPLLKARIVSTKPERKRAYRIVRRFCSKLDDVEGLAYPENLDLYLENLESIGVLEIVEGFVAFLTDGVNSPAPDYEELKLRIEAKHPCQTDEELETTQHIMRLSNKGQLLIEALQRAN